MTARRPIADLVVICHHKDRRRDLTRYAIAGAAAAWREDGLDVAFVFGADRFLPGRMALLHVDLSVVPAPYVRLAARYPRTLNGRLTDIRKSAISRHLVHPGDGYAGPVIVKSDRNCGGYGERRLAAPWTRLREAGAAWLRRQPREPMRGKTQYRVFSRRSEVPRWMTNNPRLVVERFLPERIGERFAVNNALVLGDRVSCTRSIADVPIVSTATAVATEDVAPHPELLKQAQAFGLDFGKVDYTVHDGEFVLLDLNKTVGVATGDDRSHLVGNRARWLPGIHELLHAVGSGSSSGKHDERSERVPR